MIPVTVYPAPRATRRLVAAIARRTGNRLGRLARRRSGAPPGASAVLQALLESLSGLAPETRHRVLHGPDLRGFLAEFEGWIEVSRMALDASRRSSRLRGPRRSGARGLEILFDRISRTEHLGALLPSGRIDAGFAARCCRSARRRLREAIDDLASFVLGLRLASPVAGRFSTRLAFRADP